MDRFETYLQANLPSIETFHPHYNNALGAMLLAGGKRFRPKLLLSIVEALEPLMVDSAMPVALAVEIFHTYSLIHDDLPAMDDAPLRRGHPTLHTRYDEVTAILVGDALNTEAFLRITTAPLRNDVKVKCITLLAQCGGVEGMVHGQALDCYFEKQPLGISQVEQLHTDKTAKLIAASMQMGAVIANAPTLLQKRLYELGLKLGLLFQIQDDIIDATQSDVEAGKPTGNDGDKNSFVTLLGLDEAISRADALSKEVAKELEALDVPLQEVLVRFLQPYLNRHSTKGSS